MGIAHMTKWLLWAVVLANLVGWLTGCDAEQEKARKVGEEVTRDSPGWQRLKEQDALPPEQRQREMVAPRGPVSTKWVR